MRLPNDQFRVPDERSLTIHGVEMHDLFTFYHDGAVSGGEELLIGTLSVRSWR
jgi:hypothetical protein